METYEKIDKDNLKITRDDTAIHIFEESRTEIQTKIDHLELDKAESQKQIDWEKAKIALLDK